jgi:hypothetical protein
MVRVSLTVWVDWHINLQYVAKAAKYFAQMVFLDVLGELLYDNLLGC